MRHDQCVRSTGFSLDTRFVCIDGLRLLSRYDAMASCREVHADRDAPTTTSRTNGTKAWPVTRSRQASMASVSARLVGDTAASSDRSWVASSMGMSSRCDMAWINATVRGTPLSGPGAMRLGVG